MRCPALLSCLSILATGSLVTATAQDLNVSLHHPVPTKAVLGANTQLVHEILLRMVDRWNAHDIEGLMSLYWNSPSLLAVIDTQQYEGWQNLYQSYKSQYRDPSDMGIFTPPPIQLQPLEPDLS